MLTRWWRLLSSGYPSQAGEGLPPPSPSPASSPRNEKRLRVFFCCPTYSGSAAISHNTSRVPEKTAPDRFEALAGIETIGRCFQNVAAGRAGSALGEALAELGCGRGLVEVAAGRLRERAHHLPHLLLRGGTGLGERLLDEHDKLVP